MTADCPVCGAEVVLAGDSFRVIRPHLVLGHESRACWGSVRELWWEDVRGAVEIAEEPVAQLRLAAHP